MQSLWKGLSQHKSVAQHELSHCGSTFPQPPPHAAAAPHWAEAPGALISTACSSEVSLLSNRDTHCDLQPSRVPNPSTFIHISPLSNAAIIRISTLSLPPHLSSFIFHLSVIRFIIFLRLLVPKTSGSHRRREITGYHALILHMSIIADHNKYKNVPYKSSVWWLRKTQDIKSNEWGAAVPADTIKVHLWLTGFHPPVISNNYNYKKKNSPQVIRQRVRWFTCQLLVRGGLEAVISTGWGHDLASLGEWSHSAGA